MSKQDISKGRPNPNKPGAPTAKPTANGRPPAKNNPAASRPASNGTTAPRMTGSATRPRVVAQPKKKGFRLRPLDIGLLALGIVVVGFIVFTALKAPTVGVNPNADIRDGIQVVPLGQPAPEFTLQDTEGNTHKLADYKGKVVLLEFMATWCPHCRDDAPTFTRVQNELGPQGVQVLAINATKYGKDYNPPQNKFPIATMEDIKWFKTTYAVPFPMMLDPELKSANDYGVTSYPSAYIIDQDGKVAEQPSTTALPTYDELAASITKLLKK